MFITNAFVDDVYNSILGWDSSEKEKYVRKKTRVSSGWLPSLKDRIKVNFDVSWVHQTKSSTIACIFDDFKGYTIWQQNQGKTNERVPYSLSGMTLQRFRKL